MVGVTCVGQFTTSHEIEVSDNVGTLKSKIESNTEFVSSKNCLIYKGIVLDANSPFSKYGIDNGSHLVYIRDQVKPSKQPSSKAESPTPIVREETANQMPSVEQCSILVDAGFPFERAQKALKITGFDTERAMEWLLDHIDDPLVDEPLPDN